MPEYSSLLFHELPSKLDVAIVKGMWREQYCGQGSIYSGDPLISEAMSIFCEPLQSCVIN